MASPTLIVVSWVIALFATGFGALSFGRGLLHLWRVISPGHVEPGRTTPVARRLWGVFSAALSHREFKGRPLVRAAHWLVMVSFPILFLTLVTSYAQLRDQSWSLPLIGHFPPWEWLVEVFAWGGLLGIVALMVIRARAGRPSLAEASVSGPDPIDEGGADSARRGRADRLASRFLGSTRWQAIFVEWVIWCVCAAVIALRGLEYALAHVLALGATASAPEASVVHHPLTAWIGELLLAADPSATALANAIVVASATKIVVSMAWMMVVGVQTSMGVAWHRFLAVVNLYARRNADGTKALGPAAPLLVSGVAVTSPDDFDDLAEDTTLGVGAAEDFSWKDRLDLYTCTECGRCQELCPAWNTGKPLSPKLLVMSLRDHVHSTSLIEVSTREVTEAELPSGVESVDQVEADGSMLLEKGVYPSPHSFDLLQVLAASGATGPHGVADVSAPLVPGVVSEEVLWDCTMCGACVEQCPVDIEHIDHVLDLRRHQVLMEAAFPRELGRAFRGMESKATPYNQMARKRLDWAKGLPFDVPVIGVDVDSAEEVDWLFWVGCAGAFDDRAKATSAAVAELLHTAGVSFAVLGQGESCTGDPARRAGNEALFQMLAAAAIETLNEARARKIVVSCAHCFNTIAGEYPQLGGHFEVVHHTQLLSRLIREGLLVPVAPPASEAGPTITYHDACFLGRHNRVYEAPREVLESLGGAPVVEMPRSRDRAMCCGAGGAHAWFEEKRGVRIADARMVEAASTGADIVATACPFCTQMLGSATGSSAGFTAGGSGGTEGEVAARLPEVKDVALLLLDSVRRGQASTQ